jgi:flagellar hook-length control protein FliK
VTPSDGTDLLAGKGGSDAALQLLEGKLLAQQQLDLSALTAAAPSGTAAGKGGLSFGAVVAADAQATLPAGIAAAANKGESSAPDSDPTTADADPFDPQSEDPAAQNAAGQIPAAQNARGLTAARGTTGAKPKDGDTAATSAVTAATTSPARSPSVVPPVSPSFAPAWSGSGGNNDPDENAAGYGSAAAADTDFSTLSQYLGANAAEGLASGMNTRQSAFIAQLKQNLQILPPNEQIAVQIQNAMQKGSTRLTVDLEPAELGRVEVKLNVDKDKNVTAQVVVDRPATLDLLQKDAHTLERALQDAGLQTSSGSLSFNLRDTGGQGGGAQQNGGGGQTGTGVGNGAAAAEAAKAATADIVATADGYVDLKT